MSEFVPNPAFKPRLEQAVVRALDDVRESMQRDVKRDLFPAAITRKTSVLSTPATRKGANEFGIVVRYGRGLGPIFEAGTTQRHTRKGANRGRISTANHAMKNAKESAIRRGLDLRRYL